MSSVSLHATAACSFTDQDKAGFESLRLLPESVTSDDTVGDDAMLPFSQTREQSSNRTIEPELALEIRSASKGRSLLCLALLRLLACYRIVRQLSTPVSNHKSVWLSAGPLNDPYVSWRDLGLRGGTARYDCYCALCNLDKGNGYRMDLQYSVDDSKYPGSRGRKGRPTPMGRVPDPLLYLIRESSVRHLGLACVRAPLGSQAANGRM